METDSLVFQPPRQRGLILHVGLILAAALASMALLLLASRTALGPVFLGYLLGAFAIAVPIPLLGSRLFSLLRSHYTVSRDGIILKWGFREVHLPVTEIAYVELAEDLLFPLEYPRMQWPGAVIGSHHQDGLGRVEFLASERARLVMVGSGEHVYVISPDRPNQFVLHYRQITELGSLAPLKPYSAAPTFVALDLWRMPRMRVLLVFTGVVSLAMFAVVAWFVPGLEQVSLGFDGQGQPLPPVSPGQLFLLPALNIILVAASYLLSLLLFRLRTQHPFVYALWAGNALTSLLFLLAVMLILQTG